MTGSKTVQLRQFYEDNLLRLDKAVSSPIENYAKALRDVVRALWGGNRNQSQFVSGMLSAISRHLEFAWREGAAVCGIRPDERTREEQRRLEQFIDGQMAFVPGLGKFIEENSKANGGLLRTSLNRLPPWINRWNEVKAIASTMACENQKFIWLLGQAEHCKTCLKLSGRVMRGSRWDVLDVHPQDTRPGKLCCRGFECKCSRPLTDKRATPGRLPKLPGRCK